MTTPELLSYLRGLGVELWSDGERLRLNAPPGVLTPAVREQVAGRKTEILSFLARVARSAAVPSAPVPPLVPVPRQDTVLPLSFAQQRLWFLDQLQPGSPAYNIPLVFRLPSLHQGTLAAVLAETARRHEALRTTFEAAPGGEPVQVIAPPGPVSLPLVDLSALPEEAQATEETRLFVAEARRPFDLRRAPLLRACLVRGTGRDTVVLNMHHSVSDGWSVEILIREIAALYQAFQAGRPSPLPELPLQYADYACWQRQWLRGEVLEAEISYWRERLQGAPPLLELPADRPRPPVQSFRGASSRFEAPEDLAGALISLAREHGTTIFMTLLAAFQALLHRSSGQEDISVGTPIAGRHRAEIEGLVGLFVNTLVIRTDFSRGPRFVDLLAQVREVTLEAFRHQDLPFEKLVEELRPQRSLSHSPLFQVLFTLQNFQRPDGSGTPGINRLKINSGLAKFDLSATIAEAPGRLIGGFDHNLDLFDGATVQRMVGHYTVLLQGIAERPEARISELPLLTSAERQQLLREWTDTGVRRQEALLHSAFEAQAQRTPEATAVIRGARRLTYRELDARADLLAGHLRARGVEPEEVVGLCTDRSEDMVAALLGILKAGAAYLPLDPGYPRERLALMIADAGVRKLLTRGHLAGVLPPHPGLEVLALEALHEPAPPSPPPHPVRPHQVPPDSLAYVIYTSGSTGRPKGVAISHRSAVALIEWSREVFAEEERTGVLASTSINFDLSVFELFLPLSSGGTVILVDDALALIDRPAGGAVSLLNTVPSAMAGLLQAEALPASVRTVNLAGEPLRASLVREIYRRSSVSRVYNLYGPSESTTYSTWMRLDRDFAGEPSIGRPISATSACLLDRSGEPVPIGIPGELFLGGAGLARGYLHRPDLTAERFVPAPFSTEPGARLYRTGDSVRLRPNGLLEFLGRLDAQVKIRGFRIEPAEIEAALTRHAAIRSAVVVPRGGLEAPRELAAVLVAAGEPYPSVSELRQFLGECLPSHMIPSSFSFVDELPLTASGKIDRRALADLAAGRSAGEAPYVPPQGELEQALVEIWQRVLSREPISVEDNFFDLGGDSLKTIRVLALLRDQGIEASVRDLFRHQTIRTLARHCGTTEVAAEADGHDLELPLRRIGTGVSPADLAGAEATLKAHPALDAAYLVRGSYRGEEILYCFYRLRSGEHLTEGELDEICRTRLPQDCLPSRFVELLPAVETGTVDRERLARFLDHDILDLYELGPGQDWFFTQAWRRPHSFIMYRGQWLDGTVDADALRDACQALLRRHQILNTIFPDHRLARYQLIVPPPETWSVLDLHDLSGLAVEEQRSSVERQMQAAVDSMSLDRWPLLRFLLFRTDKDQYYFLFICHHLLCDDLSMGILADDLFQLYLGLATKGRLPDLPPARNLYGEYVRWLRRFRENGGMEESLRYWQREIPPDLQMPRMPVDFPDAPDSALLREQRVVEIDPGATQRLERNAREIFKTALSPMLIALVGRAVARWSGNDDVILAEITHGRLISDQLDLERAIGFFAVGKPIRIVEAGRLGVPEVVRATAAKLSAVAPEAACHYQALWREIPNHYNKMATSLKMIFNYFGTRPGSREVTRFQPAFRNDEILPCLVEFFTAVVDGKLRITLSYSRARLRPETIEPLAALLQEDLEAGACAG